MKVAVAEPSAIGRALSSLKETALSLGRPITGSGVSTKLACLCTGVRSELNHLYLDSHCYTGRASPHGKASQLSVYIKRWRTATFCDTIFWATAFSRSYVKQIIAFHNRRACLQNLMQRFPCVSVVHMASPEDAPGWWREESWICRHRYPSFFSMMN